MKVWKEEDEKEGDVVKNSDQQLPFEEQTKLRKTADQQMKQVKEHLKDLNEKSVWRNEVGTVVQTC